MKDHLKVIGFDADDTLWLNEPNYKEAEQEFCSMLSNFAPAEKISKTLYDIEMKNLPLFGYGAKFFMLSLVETALKVSRNKIEPQKINDIIELGRKLLNKPVELLEGVEEVLKQLNSRYKLILVSKGDLFDQERKLEKSGLAKYFYHIEIMSNKEVANYSKMLQKLDINPSEFLMVGNSIRSDILPVLETGARAIHIPYHTVWQYEMLENTSPDNPRLTKLDKISDILNIL